MDGHNVASDRRWLDYAGLAAYLGVTPAALRVRVMRGELPTTRLGRRVYFDRAAIDRLLESRTVPVRT